MCNVTRTLYMMDTQSNMHSGVRFGWGVCFAATDLTSSFHVKSMPDGTQDCCFCQTKQAFRPPRPIKHHFPVLELRLFFSENINHEM